MAFPSLSMMGVSYSQSGGFIFFLLITAKMQHGKALRRADHLFYFHGWEWNETKQMSRKHTQSFSVECLWRDGDYYTENGRYSLILLTNDAC